MTSPTRKDTPRRTFTSTFAIGDTVSIKRTRHGWYDGAIGGIIVKLTDHTCVVRVGEGRDTWRAEIQHPRDIVLCEKTAPPNRRR